MNPSYDKMEAVGRALVVSGASGVLHDVHHIPWAVVYR